MRRANQIAIGTVLGIGTVFLAGSYAVMYGQFGRFASQRDAELAAAKAEGLPLEPKDLARAVSPDQNAAPVYVAGIKMLEDKSLKATRQLLTDAEEKGATQSDLLATEAGFAKYASMMDKVQRASERPECAFERDWTLGPNLLLPEYAYMKTYSKMFSLRAVLASEKGDWQSSLRDLRTCYRLARHSGQDPILIGMLVEVAQESITHAAFQQVMSKHGTDPAFLAAATKLQDEIGALPNFRHALGGEIIFGRTAIPMIDRHTVLTYSSDNVNKEPFFLEKAFFQSKPVQGAFETRFLQFWRETYHNLPKDPADWEGANDAMRTLETKLGADQSPSNWANQLLLPVFTQAATTVGKVIAQRRLDAVSLRLLGERAKTGAFPTSLPKSWGEEILDPFSGKPLAYKVEGNGFRLWSVGDDRKDDLGQTRIETGGNGSDLVLRYPLPPRPKTKPVTSNGGGFPVGGPGMSPPGMPEEM